MEGRLPTEFNSEDQEDYGAEDQSSIYIATSSAVNLLNHNGAPTAGADFNSSLFNNPIANTKSGTNKKNTAIIHHALKPNHSDLSQQIIDTA